MSLYERDIQRIERILEIKSDLDDCVALGALGAWQAGTTGKDK